MIKNKAFTLAETLITLMIIGVVAALTIPALMQQINNETLKGQRIATGSKLAKGFAQMKAEEILQEKYANTAEFVEKMKKYFQITQVCDSNNLTNCFVGTVITQQTENNETVNTENNINEIKDKDSIMGLRFSDGTSMLIKYNPDSPLAGAAWTDALTDNGKIGRLANKDSYPTYSDLFYYVVDVNNAKSPNTKGKDIVGNLVLEKGALGTDFGLGFVFIEDTAFSHGCGTINCVVDFCKEKGGRVPTHDDIMTIANKLFDIRDNGGWIGYYLKANYNSNLLSVFAATEGIVQSTSPYNEYCVNTYELADCKPGEACNFDPDSCGGMPGDVAEYTFCIK